MQTKDKPFSDRVYVQKIGKKGKGVFAAKPFKKGETIVHVKGKVISEKQANKCSRYQQDHMYTIGRNKYIVALYPDKYLNHSCDPNAYEINRKIVAKRNIRKDEEICFHYSLNVLEDFSMKCQCNHKTCRGKIIGTFFRLSKKEQKKYAPYLDDWFKKEFKNRLKNI